MDNKFCIGRNINGIQHFIKSNSGAVISAVMLIIFLITYQLRTGRSLAPFNLMILLNGGIALAFAALGETFVVISGGMDLSVGGVISLTNVVAAMFMTGSYPHDAIVVIMILLMGIGLGMINGILVALARLPSFIVTIASMFIWSGLSLLILPQPGGMIPSNFSQILSGLINNIIPWAAIWIILLIIILLSFKRTSLYTAIYAIGSSENAAYRSGIKVLETKITVYVLAGLCYAMAGLFLSAQTTGGDPNIGEPFLLFTFAAVVVGGTPFGGGQGTFMGSIFGAYIMSLLDNLLLSFNVTSFTIDIVQGIIIIFVVSLPFISSRFAFFQPKLLLKKSNTSNCKTNQEKMR